VTRSALRGARRAALLSAVGAASGLVRFELRALLSLRRPEPAPAAEAG
jgi:hypothetical protein